MGYFSGKQELIENRFLKFKPLIMKRILVMFALAGSLAACNNSANSTGEKKDSLDSLASEKKEVVDSNAQLQKDRIDSSTEHKKDAIDSLNKKESTKK